MFNEQPSLKNIVADKPVYTAEDLKSYHLNDICRLLNIDLPTNKFDNLRDYNRAQVEIITKLGQSDLFASPDDANEFYADKLAKEFADRFNGYSTAQTTPSLEKIASF